ncbi:hypothetical protein METHB2_100019 [Candidatus Methylobacter favarea]|uniref:Uncharacterized protein n=1 Tax=Candidatus Methylobacter favarea TaxID=2707345 RepID=A0A8S0Y5M2_9GAMM|nr:hypothetical protein METHB2_100019 [Candidatus Methylobacter favarea]
MNLEDVKALNIIELDRIKPGHTSIAAISLLPVRLTVKTLHYFKH